MRRVYVESPYAGEIEKNLLFLRRCLADCFKRGEAPFASHGLYTQHGVLDDTIPDERVLGIRAGFEFALHCDATVVYVDRGISFGMIEGMRHAVEHGRPVEIRCLKEIPDHVHTHLYELNNELGFF
jgi:hypothetical protein